MPIQAASDCIKLRRGHAIGTMPVAAESCLCAAYLARQQHLPKKRYDRGGEMTPRPHCLDRNGLTGRGDLKQIVLTRARYGNKLRQWQTHTARQGPVGKLPQGRKKKRPLRERPEFREETPEKGIQHVCCDAQYAPGCWEWQVFWRPLHGAVDIYMINILVSSCAGLGQADGTDRRLGG